MGSPVKQKYKEGVQHEILTNYYLSKYDKYMSNYRDREVPTIQPAIQQYRSIQHNNPNVKRKNFKELILEKKASREGYGSRQGQRKNFRQEIQKKNSLQKVQKQNRKNFYDLEGSIMSELYRPSPSRFEKGKFEQIEVVHKISYQDKNQSNQSFRYQIIEGREQQNIYFRNQQRQEQQKPSKFQISFEQIEDNKLASAIRTTFERRSPNKNRSKSREQSSISKISPSNYNTKSRRKVDAEEEAIYYENVRSNFQNVQKDRERQREKEKQKNFLPKNFNDISQNSDFHKANDSSVPQDDKRSVDSRGSKVSKQLSFDRNKKNLNQGHPRRGSVSHSIHNGRKNSSFHDDSFHRNVPQIQQEPKISILKAQQAKDRQKLSEKELDKERAQRSQNYDSNHSQAKSSKQNMNNQSFNRSNHEFSMISRFSMASQQGGVIKEELEKQLNQNQIGPYQNALTTLLSLLNEHPNAWPIYVVGQRILDDRHQYQAKRLGQQNQLSKIQIKIEKEKRSHLRKNEIQKNTTTIFKLVRMLSSLLQKH